MSMTRDEIIEAYESAVFSSGLSAAAGNEEAARDYELLKTGLDALRAPIREQVERVWRGEWVHTHSSDNFWTEVWKCSHCDFEDNYGECFDFCPFCGAAQTDEAVQMVMERLEEIKNG